MRNENAPAESAVTGESSIQDLSVSMSAANFYALVTAGLAVILLGAAYSALWDYGRLEALSAVGLLPLLAVLAAGIVAHEAIHGLSWAAFGRKPLGSLKFGFQVRTLTPYAHLEEPVEARAYRLGAAAPGIVMGLLPSLVGIATGGGAAMLFGLVFTFAAGGDALILWLLRGVEPNALVKDHPTRAGCYVLGHREE